MPSMRRAGFTLIELILVSVLLSLVFAGLLGLMVSAIRTHSMVIGKTTTEDQAALLGQSIFKACESASYIALPPLPAGTLTLAMRVWNNVDPEDGASPIVGAAPQIFSHFCADATRNFFVYQGNGPPPGPAIATCGTPPPPGVSRVQLTGGPLGTAVVAQFTRQAANQVYVSYSVTTPPGVTRPGHTVTRETLVEIQEAQ